MFKNIAGWFEIKRADVLLGYYEFDVKERMNT
jgi:hypothetical protein